VANIGVQEAEARKKKRVDRVKLARLYNEDSKGKSVSGDRLTRESVRSQRALLKS
jgi:hypothetical protein